MNCGAGQHSPCSPAGAVAELERDYVSMQVMLFGAAPAFDTILRSFADLEAEINAAG